MKGISIEERAINLAQYIIETGDTVRGTAKKFGISKSTVHMDVSEMQFLKIPKFIALSNTIKSVAETKVRLAIKI